MKTLVLYYSFEGNTEMMAQLIAKTLEADIERLTPKKEIGTHGFMKYFWGGRQAIMKEKPLLEPIRHSIHDYDLIIFGSPVWAYTFSPPVRTFLANQSLKNKRIALFLCHGGGPKNAMSDFKNAAIGATLTGEIDFKEPLKFETEMQIQKAVMWANTLVV